MHGRFSLFPRQSHCIRSIDAQQRGPFENLTDAVQVAASMDEQSDALIGFFIDQARRTGAPWSEIGARMGVSKQAGQTTAEYLAAVLLSEPDAVAARVIHGAGIADAQVLEALGPTGPEVETAVAKELADLMKRKEAGGAA
jgi:hypothetical protein